MIEKFKHILSAYKVVAIDSYCGEPIAWGYEIINCTPSELQELKINFNVEFIDGWVIVEKTLTREEAIKKYGPITHEEFGPKGGWKYVTFGNKNFKSKKLKP